MQPETQRHFPGNWIQRTTTHASPTRPPAPPDKTPLVTPAVTQQQPVVHIAKLSPPVGQFVIQTLLQIAGFGLAVAFGIYAVKSVTVGTIANDYGDKSVQQAIVSNQLAMLAICLSMTNQVWQNSVAADPSTPLFSSSIMLTPPPDRCSIVDLQPHRRRRRFHPPHRRRGPVHQSPTRKHCSDYHWN